MFLKCWSTLLYYPVVSIAVCCSVLQCVGSVLQCVAVCCSVLQCVAVCCSVCCSVWQQFREPPHRCCPICANPRFDSAILIFSILFLFAPIFNNLGSLPIAVAPYALTLYSFFCIRSILNIFVCTTNSTVF